MSKKQNQKDGYGIGAIECVLVGLILVWWIYAILAPFKNRDEVEAFRDYISNYQP